MAYRVFLPAAALILLSACDSRQNCFSGPCDGSTAVGGPGAGGLMTVNENNALDALREAWFAGVSAASIPTFVVETGVGDTSGGTAIKVFALTSPMASLAGRNRVYMTPFQETYNCPVSGTFLVSGDVEDPQTVTAGDYADYESSACNSGTGYTVDGAHSLDIISVDGDPNSGEYEQVQLLTLNGFRATSQNTVTTLDGDHTAAIDSRTAGIITNSFSGTALTIVEDQVTMLVSGFSGLETIQTADPFTWSLGVAGRANSSLVTGSFDFLVEETLQQRPGEYPFDGILRIVGTNDSTARIAVIDETALDFQVDANGSDNFEISIRMTWEEFFNGSGSIGAVRVGAD